MKQTNLEGRHLELDHQTCLNAYYRKSSFNGICANSSLVQQPTLLSQATGHDLVAELLADKRSHLVRLYSFP